MKIGIRKPSLKKAIKASTTGKAKRAVKKAVNPLYGKKGVGLAKNPKEKKKKEEKTTLPMLRFGSNSVRITEDELVMLSNRYNEYVESTPDEGFITWLLKRGL